MRGDALEWASKDTAIPKRFHASCEDMYVFQQTMATGADRQKKMPLAV
jgi:hypothetical protein